MSQEEKEYREALAELDSQMMASVAIVQANTNRAIKAIDSFKRFMSVEVLGMFRQRRRTYQPSYTDNKTGEIKPF